MLLCETVSKALVTSIPMTAVVLAAAALAFRVSEAVMLVFGVE